MGSDKWIVNNRAGGRVGLITRLILNSVTRQIGYADVVVIQTGHVARIPRIASRFEAGPYPRNA